MTIPGNLRDDRSCLLDDGRTAALHAQTNFAAALKPNCTFPDQHSCNRRLKRCRVQDTKHETCETVLHQLMAMEKFDE